MKVTLLILTLNEIKGMEQIMPRIRKEWVDQIIIVDGGSTDGTLEYAREKGYFVYKQSRTGLRHAYIEALEHSQGDVIIAFSPDGNSIPELIPPLIDKMNAGYDMVVVSRYLDGAKSYDDDIITGFGNWFFTKTVNILYRANYTDAMVMYRAVKRDVFYRLDLHKEKWYLLPEKLFRTKVCLIPLLSVRAAKRKLKTAEIPGDEPPRIGSDRKLKIFRWGAAYYFQFIRELFLWR